ncbi:hypothetical protein ATANTOWER_019437 [Ataeniobius toweri]|uniref:Uncharacterized protein n=1 Tax=Ataeniobius toweri TaxID=208326 RepID=A0ABU7B0K4_9TELE|nr:hypothetical protein [Ataeniobius toweri]
MATLGRSYIWMQQQITDQRQHFYSFTKQPSFMGYHLEFGRIGELRTWTLHVLCFANGEQGEQASFLERVFIIRGKIHF